MLRTVVKNSVFWTYVNVLRPVPRKYLGMRGRQRVVVLIYHRVNDELRDGVTVSLQQFDEQMAWLSRHCEVIDIEDLVRHDVRRDAGKPMVVVTFDDGYADNYDNAVPILQRHGVTAAFFVSTGMIGSDNGFAHDLRKLGYALPNMNWDQLRHMKELGFTVGSHTVTHLNCGASDIDTVRNELIESRDTLREQLGLDEMVFAYPFGGRSHITPQALQAVKEVGYIGCLSAYGGCITDDIDPFDVPRTGVGSGFNLLAYQARLQGYCP